MSSKISACYEELSGPVTHLCSSSYASGLHFMEVDTICGIGWPGQHFPGGWARSKRSWRGGRRAGTRRWSWQSPWPPWTAPALWGWPLWTPPPAPLPPPSSWTTTGCARWRRWSRSWRPGSAWSSRCAIHLSPPPPPPPPALAVRCRSIQAFRHSRWGSRGEAHG